MCWGREKRTGFLMTKGESAGRLATQGTVENKNINGRPY